VALDEPCGKASEWYFHGELGTRLVWLGQLMALPRSKRGTSLLCLRPIDGASDALQTGKGRSSLNPTGFSTMHPRLSLRRELPTSPTGVEKRSKIYRGSNKGQQEAHRKQTCRGSGSDRCEVTSQLSKPAWSFSISVSFSGVKPLASSPFSRLASL
jgi:hypothetical protein